MRPHHARYTGLIAFSVASIANANEPEKKPDAVVVSVPRGASPGTYECKPKDPAEAPTAKTQMPGPFAGIGPDDGMVKTNGLELLLRASYTIAEPQSPVRFAPGPGGGFATDPGGLYDGSEAPYRGGFQINAGSGYRFTRRFSAGLGGSFTKLLTSAITDGTKDLARLAFSIAPYARVYLPISRSLEFWGAVGVGFKQDTQTFDRPTTAAGSTQSGKWTMTHEGIAVPVGFGLDIRATDSLFIGPSAQYLGVIATGGCLQIDASNLQKKWCTSDTNSVTRAFSYQQLTIGLSVRLSFL
jgi:hypothetical protein